MQIFSKDQSSGVNTNKERKIVWQERGETMIPKVLSLEHM